MSKVYKVFSDGRYTYCYNKPDALKQREYMKSLGFSKVQIKGRQRGS